MQALNPLLVMLLIPFNNIVLYPSLRRLGFEPTALRRMGSGIAFSGLAWIGAGLHPAAHRRRRIRRRWRGRSCRTCC